MSVDLRTQIRAYAGRIDAEQTEITVEEILARQKDRDGTEPLIGLDRPRVRSTLRQRGVWVAAAAAVITLVVFGVSSWLSGSEEPVPPAEPTPVVDPQGRVPFAPTDIPDSFVLLETGGSNYAVTYRSDTANDVWLPSDGGFSISSSSTDPNGAVSSTYQHLDSLLTELPDSVEVDLSGRRAVLFESTFNQGDVAARHVSLLVAYDESIFFEIEAFGMSREGVLEVADGVAPISVDRFREMERSVPWSHLAAFAHESFSVQAPEAAAGRDVSVVLGADVFSPRLFPRVGETDPVYDREPQSSIGYLLLPTNDDIATEDFLELRSDPAVFAIVQSPAVAQEQWAQLVDEARDGTVLSEEPYVLAADEAPSPSIATDELGTEIRIVPVESYDELPDILRRSLDQAAASEAQPAVVVGVATEVSLDGLFVPGVSDAEPAVLAGFIDPSGDLCRHVSIDSTGGAGCGWQQRFGVAVTTTSTRSAMSYVVPTSTAVVQILTADGSYWQRPFHGYGIVPYGSLVSEPTGIIALADDGSEIAQWDVP